MKSTTTLTGVSILILTTGIGSTVLAVPPPTNAPPPVFIPAGDMALPANALPGKCYARVYEDPKYRTENEQVMEREASDRIQTIPAKYEQV